MRSQSSRCLLMPARHINRGDRKSPQEERLLWLPAQEGEGPGSCAEGGTTGGLLEAEGNGAPARVHKDRGGRLNLLQSSLPPLRTTRYVGESNLVSGGARPRGQEELGGALGACGRLLLLGTPEGEEVDF